MVLLFSVYPSRFQYFYRQLFHHGMKIVISIYFCQTTVSFFKMNKSIIKFAIADDHKIFRDGIKMALTNKEDLKLIWEASDGKEMIEKITVKKPDVLLMDIRMPEIDGISAIPLVHKQHKDIKIIVLSMYEDPQMVSKVMEKGANAYLSKTSDPAEIYNAIQACVKDDFYFNDFMDKAIMNKLLRKKNQRQHYDSDVPVQFNEKELKILQLLAEDKTTEEISKIVFLSPRTVENIRQNMKAKVDAKTVSGLIMYGLRNKLIE